MNKGFFDERGAVLVIALLVMAVLSLIGTIAVMTSSIEINISANESLAKQAFYAAEAGWTVAVCWLDTQAAPFLGNREVSDVPVGKNTYSYTLRYQTPPRNIPGYSMKYKEFRYVIDSTGQNPGSLSHIQVTAGKAYRVGY